MNVGDKVTLLIHGAGVLSEETHVIKEVDDISLTLEDKDGIFVKNITGNYITATSSFGFWFEIKGEDNGN